MTTNLGWNIDWTVVATFALLWAAVVPTPGANSLMVMHVALTRAPKHLTAAIVGNVTGILLLALGAIFGLTLLLETFVWLRAGISLVGGLYLLYLGYRLLRHAREISGAPSVAEASPSAEGKLSSALVQGFLTSISNAQAVVFITSMLAIAGALRSSVATGLMCVGVIVLFNGAYLSFLGWLLRRPTARAGYLRFRAVLEALFGGFFLLLGGRLIWTAIGRQILMAR